MDADTQGKENSYYLSKVQVKYRLLAETGVSVIISLVAYAL